MFLKEIFRTKQIITTHSDVGWKPTRPIFHERSGSRDEHEEHEDISRGETRENHSKQQD